MSKIKELKELCSCQKTKYKQILSHYDEGYGSGGSDLWDDISCSLMQLDTIDSYDQKMYYERSDREPFPYIIYAKKKED